MDRLLFVISFFLIIGCTSSSVEMSRYQDFHDFVKSIKFKQVSEGIFTDNKFHHISISSQTIPMQKAEQYCQNLTGHYMNSGISFNQDSNLYGIPSMITMYTHNIKTDIDFSYFPCTLNNKTLFSVLKYYKTNQRVQYIIFHSDKIDKSLKMKKKQNILKKKRNLKNNIKVQKLQQRKGVIKNKYFTQFIVGRISVYNKNNEKKLYSKKVSIEERLCALECTRLNQLNSGYLSLTHATDNGWFIVRKTNHSYAKEIKRIDGTYCGCYGNEYILKK